MQAVSATFSRSNAACNVPLKLSLTVLEST